MALPRAGVLRLLSPARQQSPRMREATAQYARGRIVADAQADPHEAGTRERDAGASPAGEDTRHAAAALDEARAADARGI